MIASARRQAGAGEEREGASERGREGGKEARARRGGGRVVTVSMAREGPRATP